EISPAETGEETRRARRRVGTGDLQDHRGGTWRPDLGRRQSNRRKCVFIRTEGCCTRGGSHMRSKRVAVLAMGAALAVLACHKRTPAPVAAARPVATPPVVPRPTPPPVVAPGPEPLPRVAPPPPDALPLEPANRAFLAGNYDDAARLYETYLKTNPLGRYR